MTIGYEEQKLCIQRLKEALEECLEYFEAHYDVVDGDYGQPHANKEMQMGQMIEMALERKPIMGQKIVINCCFGGFGLSSEAQEWLKAKGGDNINFRDDTNRAHPLLVEMVQTLGKTANTRFSDLRIVEIPDNVKWQIEEYDGSEHIAEKHRTWR